MVKNRPLAKATHDCGVWQGSLMLLTLVGAWQCLFTTPGRTSCTSLRNSWIGTRRLLYLFSSTWVVGASTAWLCTARETRLQRNGLMGLQAYTSSFTSSSTLPPKPLPTPGVEEPSVDWNAGGRPSRNHWPYWLHQYWPFCMVGMGVSWSYAVSMLLTGSLGDHEWRRITEELYRDLS